MKRFLNRFVGTLALTLILVSFFGSKAYAYSERPDYFDFGETVIKMDAGTTKDVLVSCYYDYTYYLGPHSSALTYMECSFKGGTQYVKLHIGPDETEKNVFFYFYVDDERVQTTDVQDCIEVYVQSIDPAAVEAKQARDAELSALKNYSGNNAEFNAYYYYTNYKDLQDAFGADPDKLFDHYNRLGKSESRVANRAK